MKYTSHPHDWTLERSALLRRLWNDEGLSGGEIAERMGLSRNAVIGRAHRMGLQKRNDRKANAQKANVTKRSKRLTRRELTHKVSSMTLPAAPAAPVDAGEWKEVHVNFEPRGLIQIWDLEPHHCRWPYDGEPRTTYCGHDRLVDSSYCRKHHETGTVPRKPLTRVHPSLYK
jgi:GcrA cell cycle regulator